MDNSGTSIDIADIDRGADNLSIATNTTNTDEKVDNSSISIESRHK